MSDKTSVVLPLSAKEPLALLSKRIRKGDIAKHCATVVLGPDFLGWTAFVLGVGTALLQLPEVSLHPPCSEQGPLSLREPPDNAVEPTTPTTLKTVLLPTSSYLSTSNVRHFYFVHWSVYQPLLFCTNHRAFPVLLF